MRADQARRACKGVRRRHWFEADHFHLEANPARKNVGAVPQLPAQFARAVFEQIESRGLPESVAF